MSTARTPATARIRDTLRQVIPLQSIPSNSFIDETTDAVIDAIYPEIADAKQLKGVPEGSILIATIPGGVRPLTWERMELYGRLPGIVDPVAPQWVINKYGPLTVVWMP